MLRTALLGTTAVIVVVIAFVVAGPVMRDAERPAPPRDSPATTAPDAGGDAGPTDVRPPGRARPPRTPPARICESRSLRGGPSTRPRGAVVVRPSQRLDLVVGRHGAGTTFWLAPGRHTLGDRPYDQVTPEDGDTILGAPGVVIDGRHLNRYAFGGDAVGVTLEYLAIRNFGRSLTDNLNEGVVNHDGGHRWRMSHLDVRANAGAGVFLGSGAVVRHSCLADNGQYGLSAYAPEGVENVHLVHNEIARNNTADWETRRPGCGCAGGAKFWAVRNATVAHNWVHDNRGVGLWADTDNTGFLFQGNYIANNTNSGIAYETSYNANVVANTFKRNAIVDGPKVGFPQPALYISESGSDPRAGSRFGTEFLVRRNLFVDNYSGVVLWENADRFAGSPANTSSGETTLVNPGVATVEACGDPTLIGTAPYYDDCRWKTQNVRVTGNRFVFRPTRIGRCAADELCGFVGVFSQWGTFPDWSPYRGAVVEDAITFDQGNLFARNTYVGPWRFMAHELGSPVTWAQWQTTYGQDPQSRRRG